MSDLLEESRRKYAEYLWLVEVSMALRKLEHHHESQAKARRAGRPMPVSEEYHRRLAGLCRRLEKGPEKSMWELQRETDKSLPTPLGEPYYG